MKPRHTPGPWHVQTSDNHLVGLLIKPIPGCVVAEMDEAETSEETQANARLIAAAPDLLAHLKVMIEMAMRAAPADCGRDQSDIDDAQAMVAKAEGRE